VSNQPLQQEIRTFRFLSNSPEFCSVMMVVLPVSRQA
jgi:hypothetical protein